jgi:hypothetical protein
MAVCVFEFIETADYVYLSALMLCARPQSRAGWQQERGAIRQWDIIVLGFSFYGFQPV